MEENDQYATTKVEAKDFTSGWLVALIVPRTTLTLFRFRIGYLLFKWKMIFK
jgi:hypothetical protein